MRETAWASPEIYASITSSTASIPVMSAAKMMSAFFILAVRLHVDHRVGQERIGIRRREAEKTEYRQRLHGER